MTLKMSVDCSCGGNLIVLSDMRPNEKVGVYDHVEVFFHEGKNECEENSICEYLYSTNQHQNYFDVIRSYVISKQNKTHREKVKK